MSSETVEDAYVESKELELLLLGWLEEDCFPVNVDTIPGKATVLERVGMAGSERGTRIDGDAGDGIG
ncbi:hypothetical protein I305_01223 [Cryptococcus gattii E566]|nr:hypothetical protein I305_01223 [Cryptococcus gattii E566]